MDYEFVQKYMEPKRTGNIIRDLNPMSKLNLMLVLGLSPFIVQNYIYGFGMVLFFILVSLHFFHVLESAAFIWSISFSG